MAVVIGVNGGGRAAFHTLPAAGATRSECQIPDISAGTSARSGLDLVLLLSPETFIATHFFGIEATGSK